MLPSSRQTLIESYVLEEDSPYPEVRSAVANTDDPDIPVSTLRAWVIGLVWAMIIPGLNQFFYMRFPSVMVSSVSQARRIFMDNIFTALRWKLVAQLLSFPIGRIWARYIPRVRLFGVSLNPGPFTVKEHVRPFALRGNLVMPYDLVV